MDKQFDFAAEAPRQRSRGEKVFDWVTYSGINGIGTFALTLPVAYWMKYGGGKPHFDHAAEKIEKDFLPRFLPILSENKRAGFSKGFLDTSILMQGGNLMLIPVGIAEHYKVPIVRGLNQFLGDKTDPASIEEAPKPSIGTLVLSRLRAFGVIFASFMVAGHFFKDRMAQFENGAARALCAFLGRAPFKEEAALVGKALEVPTTTYKVGQLGALDVFATAAATVLLYDGSHKMAKNRQLKREGKQPEHRGLLFDEAEVKPLPTRPGTVISEPTRAPDRVASTAALSTAI